MDAVEFVTEADLSEGDSELRRCEIRIIGRQGLTPVTVNGQEATMLHVSLFVRRKAAEGQAEQRAKSDPDQCEYAGAILKLLVGGKTFVVGDKHNPPKNISLMYEDLRR